VAQLAEAGALVAGPDDDMVEHFDLEELARPDQVAANLDVRFRRLRLARWMEMGRPPAPKGKARSGFVGTRLLPAEDREIQEAIRRSGQSKSDWIREALLRAARRAGATASR